VQGSGLKQEVNRGGQCVFIRAPSWVGAGIPHLNRLTLLLCCSWRTARALSGRFTPDEVIGRSNGARTELASAIVYERRIRELRITNSLNRVKLQRRLGFRHVPFGLSLLFPHRPSDNTARTKILDRTPYRNCQQLDRLCNWIANFTAWLYTRKLVLHLRICVQYAVVAQGTNAHKSRSDVATGIVVPSLTALG
jgi:hypothetical protein